MKDSIQTMIAEILDKSRTPCPQIVPVIHLLGTDGKYHGPCGFAWGVEAVKPYQTKCIGYAYQDRNGTTYGKLQQTESALREGWEKSEQWKAEQFKGQLEAMTTEQVKMQHEYWITQ